LYSEPPHVGCYGKGNGWHGRIYQPAAKAETLKPETLKWRTATFGFENRQ
jgi:hypothetical protein